LHKISFKTLSKPFSRKIVIEVKESLNDAQINEIIQIKGTYKL
jgi:hypothetical protein